MPKYRILDLGYHSISGLPLQEYIAEARRRYAYDWSDEELVNERDEDVADHERLIALLRQFGEGSSRDARVVAMVLECQNFSAVAREFKRSMTHIRRIFWCQYRRARHQMWNEKHARARGRLTAPTK